MSTTVFAAAYTATYVITESNGTTYTMLGIIEDSPSTWLAANGYIEADALDTRIETLAGLEKPHLVTDDKILTAVPIPADSQTNLNFTTGNSDLTSMNIITGYEGYITTLDAPALELGDNFEVEFTDTYVDTGAGASKYLLYKQNAFQIYISGADTITASINASFAGGLTVYFRSKVDAASAGTMQVRVYLRNSAGAESSSAFQAVNNVWTNYNATFAVSPFTGAAWTLFEINSLEIGIQQDSQPAGGEGRTVETSQLYATIDGYTIRPNGVGTYTEITTVVPALTPHWQVLDEAIADDADYVGTYCSNPPDAQVIQKDTYTFSDVDWCTVTGAITTGEHDIIVLADSVNMELYVDTILLDTAALGAGTTPDNVNDWRLMDNSTTDFMPYMGQYQHTVGGTLIVNYAPITIISGTVLPDREGAAQNGAFTWGTNPAGIAVVLGSLTSVSQPSPGQTLDDPNLDILPAVEVSDWYEEPDVTGILLTNPLRPFVTIMSDATSMTEMQAWRLLGLAFVLFCTVAAAVAVRNHLLIAGIICGAAIGLMVAFTIFPLWSVVFIIGAVAAGIVAERSPSL